MDASPFFGRTDSQTAGSTRSGADVRADARPDVGTDAPADVTKLTENE